MKTVSESRILGLLAALLTAGITSSALAQSWRPAPSPLITRWEKDVNPATVLPEYPRPQMVRQQWMSLNGLWQYALTPSASTQPPAEYAGQILVPFPYESALSGIGKPSIPDQRLWYRRSFAFPEAWRGQRILMNFGAVNYESAVYVNGRKVSQHIGGFDAFSVDVTEQLKSGENEIIVSACNPIRADVEDAQVLGKQRIRSGEIFYTASTGIWQPVWLEPVPGGHITDLKLVPDIDAEALRVNVVAEGGVDYLVRVEARDGGKLVTTGTGRTGTEILLPVREPKLWSPNDPHLYELQVSLEHSGRKIDTVASYFAMRKISLGTDPLGHTKILLNNQPYFQIGTLDQGYWPEGIYTAPTDEALRFDIEATKELGFNLIRKHAKVEPARWYYHCDRLGMLVWQDMPQMAGLASTGLSLGAKQQFENEWRRIIAQHRNAPCIVVWTIFNEGWGRHDVERLTTLTKQLDPSRLVDTDSGGPESATGDLQDIHAYPGPDSGIAGATRAAVDGEFGGITMAVPNHRWNNQEIKGYGTVLNNNAQLSKRYQDLMRVARRLAKERGTSAFIYTQITDIEQEVNGLYTYDRQLKMDKAMVQAANLGNLPQVATAPTRDFLPTSENDPQTWRYTLTKPADDWIKENFDASHWALARAPFGNIVVGFNTSWTTDDIWMQRTFMAPSTLPKQLNVLLKHDEDTEVYINGILATAVHGFFNDSYRSERMNPEALAALKSGPNTIAVHCHQITGGQFIDVGLTETQ